MPALRPRPRHARMAALGLLATLVAFAALAPPSSAAKRARRDEGSRALEHVTASRPAFGAQCGLEADGRARVPAERAAADALDAVAALGAALDRGAPGSELARLERVAASERLACSPALWSALTAALEVARETDGAYDPTVAAIADAWRAAAPLRPGGGALAEARDRTGWRQLGLESGARVVRFGRAGMALDLDGVGRGAALDHAADSLRARGLRRVRLTLGDVTRVYADEGDGWALTIGDPRDDGRVLLGLRARQTAMATLGAGARLFDPRTGMPVLGEASVTVLARSAARAQALARALRVMGRDAAAAFVARHHDVGAVWLEVDGSTVTGWRWNAPMVVEAPGEPVRWME